MIAVFIEVSATGNVRLVATDGAEMVEYAMSATDARDLAEDGLRSAFGGACSAAEAKRVARELRSAAGLAERVRIGSARGIASA